MKPLIALTLLYISGIFLGSLFSISPLFLFSALFVLFIGAIFSYVLKRIFSTNLLLSFTIVFLGMLLYHLLGSPLSRNHIAHHITGKEIFLTGMVSQDPERQEERIHLIIKASKLEDENKFYNVSGLVQVTIYKATPGYEYGDILKIRGNLREPPSPSNPGEFDYRAYLAQQKIFALLRIKDERVIEKLGRGDRNPLFSLALYLKHRMLDIFNSTLPSPHSYLLAGIMLGNRTFLSKDIQNQFVDTGVAHVLAVSGLNVGMVTLIFFLLLRSLYIPRKIAAGLNVIFIIIFTLIVGGQPSVVRAAIMAIVVLVGMIIERDPDITNSLALAALIILIPSPLILFNISFQLSFVATLGLIYLTSLIEEKLKFLPHFLALAISASLACQLATLPIVAYYFNKISTIALLANLIVVPLVGLVTALGFTIFFSGLVSLSLAKVFSATNWLALSLLLRSISFFTNFPRASLRVPTPQVFLVIAYYSILALVLLGKYFINYRVKILIATLAIFTVLIWIPFLSSTSKELEVTFLNVGQGDAIFIRFPQGGNMLIDGGEGGDYDRGERVISPFLWKKGIMKIDTILLTHPHSDHLGGLITVLENFKVRQVIDNGETYNSDSYQKYLKILEGKRIPRLIARAGQEILGYEGVRIRILNPQELLRGETNSSQNNNSLVVKITYGGVSLLLTGDIEREGQEGLLPLGGELKSTIIKVPHHGSRDGCNPQFLSLVKPEVAIITVGRDGQSAFPAASTLAEYERLGTKIYRTDRNGAITITTDGKTYKLNNFSKSSLVVPGL